MGLAEKRGLGRGAVCSALLSGGLHLCLPLAEPAPQFAGYVILMIYIFTSHADFRTQPHERDSVSCGFHLRMEVKCEIEKLSLGLWGGGFPTDCDSLMNKSFLRILSK